MNSRFDRLSHEMKELETRDLLDSHDNRISGQLGDLRDSINESSNDYDEEDNNEAQRTGVREINTLRRSSSRQKARVQRETDLIRRGDTRFNEMITRNRQDSQMRNNGRRERALARRSERRIEDQIRENTPEKINQKELDHLQEVKEEHFRKQKELVRRLARAQRTTTRKQEQREKERNRFRDLERLQRRLFSRLERKIEE